MSQKKGDGREVGEMVVVEGAPSERVKASGSKAARPSILCYRDGCDIVLTMQSRG